MPHTLLLPELQALVESPGPTVAKNRSSLKSAISPTARSPLSARYQLVLGVSFFRSALGVSVSDQTKLGRSLDAPTASCSPVENAIVRLPILSTETIGAAVTG